MIFQPWIVGGYAENFESIKMFLEDLGNLQRPQPMSPQKGNSVRESTQSGLNLGEGFLINCPDHNGMSANGFDRCSFVAWSILNCTFPAPFFIDSWTFSPRISRRRTAGVQRKETCGLEKDGFCRAWEEGGRGVSWKCKIKVFKLTCPFLFEMGPF